MIHNAAQYLAITTLDRNLIVVAGAGSGKTRVLVERYLNLLDQNPEWALNSLVAITFTQKAANEMRDRVRQTLTSRFTDSQADSVIAERWAAHLSAMDSARIDTIHGLCASILRANAAEAGVDPDFEVLDEVQSELLLDDAIDDFLRSLAYFSPPDPALRLIREYDTRAVRAVLKTFAFAGAAGKVPPLPDDLLGAWGDQWRSDAAANILTFTARIPAFPDFDPRGEDSLSQSWGVIFDNFERLLTTVGTTTIGTMAVGATAAEATNSLSIQNDISRLFSCMDALTAITSIRLPGKVAAVWGDDGDAAKDAIRSIRTAAHAALDLIGSPPNELDQIAAELIPLWDSLVRRAHAAYQEAKQARAALDFDDLEILTCDLLERYPHVCARYRNAEFRHLLVDEFQDTNANQWRIVQALADVGQGGSLFVVGDPKQSIYAFRGADVSVFDDVREQFKLLATTNQEINMALSFRAHHGLVACFNFLFEQVLQRDDSSPVSRYQVRFDAMEANRIPSPADLPPVELMLLDMSQLDKHDSSVESGRRWEASALANRVREIVEVERRIIYDREKDTLRPINYGDIALLFQTMTNVGLYEEAFKDAGLPYVTIAGRGYYDRQEVWDMLNLLRALHYPTDDLSLAAVLRSPMFALSDDALYGLRSLVDDQGEHLSLWDALFEFGLIVVPSEETGWVKFAWACLSELRALAGRVTIAELLRLALERTGYLAMLTGLPDGARRRGNVEKLLEKARTSGQTSLGKFSQYLTDLTELETREGEALLEADDAIKLMTVHKSKGLEFPLVVLVDVSHNFVTDRDSAALINTDIGLACRIYDPDERKLVSPFVYRRAATYAKLRDEAERKRLLYVAATRAQDYLLFSGQIRFNKDGELTTGGWLKWLAGAFNLENTPIYDGAHLDFAWGRARLHLPPPPDAKTPSRYDDAPTSWSLSPDLVASAMIPPLMLAPPAERDAPARSMSATQIANLGGAAQAFPNYQRPVYAARWRSATFHHAPPRIDRVSDMMGKQFPRKVGEIVHRMLCITPPDAPREKLQLLAESIAWEQGILDEAECERAVRESLRLLARVETSDVSTWIRESRSVYKELPFVFRTEKRMIHGVMDVLVERAEDDWAVIDYKTNWLGTSSPSGAQLAVYARRYTLQVGVYAAAVSELVPVVPRTYIHYIRYNHTVEIKEAEWRSALAKLEHYIGDLMQEDES